MASTYPKSFVCKKTVVDEDMKKIFLEKRKARFDEIQAKIQAQREKRTNSNENLTKLVPTKNMVTLSQKKPVTTCKKSTGLRTPQIKQTKASQLRLEKNNPLVKYNPVELEKIVKQAEETNKKVQSIQKPKFRTSPCVNQNRSSRFDSAKKTNISETSVKKSVRPPLRRSISAMHMKKKQDQAQKRCVNFTGILKAHSEENISFCNEINIPSPIIEERDSLISKTAQKAVMFITPKRSSQNFYTPISRTPAPSELRERLLNWLKKRGKSLNAYSHLRCFGVHQSTPYRSSRGAEVIDNDEDENKENRPDLAPIQSTSQFIPKVVDYTNFTSNSDLFGTPDQTADNKKLAQAALCDLHALIIEKYPEDQCNAWLSALQKKFPYLQEQPQYWECRAALGEINNEFNEAVKCYQNAIITGAELKKIDHSIEKLLEKFSVLDLDTSTKKQDTKAKIQRSKIILDARNVFKSSVIKFAVQQRETKVMRTKNDPTTPLVARPVRRSTRLSRSVFESTPKEKVYNSLNEIDTSLGQCVSFQTNRALFEQ